MSPFETFQEPSMIPTTISDQSGPILVGFPNEAIIADWPHRELDGDARVEDSEPALALDYLNDSELMVCAAADTRW